MTKKVTTTKARKPKGYKKMNGGAWIRKEKRLAIYLRDGFKCSYCGTHLKDANPFDINLDHLIPRGLKGSTNEPTNLVTACRSCNSSRQDKAWRKFATGGAIKRIERLVRRKLNIDLAKALIAGKTGQNDN